ncbi:tautomerase family protein [Mycolicibacterium phlei]|jgi:phenylpyruvate tautomerase PptA (4-oxalocrotonate tautomerase family)
MPIYTVTTARGTLAPDTKAQLAAEVTRIHSDVNHVPSTYVNVVFTELDPDNVYTDAKPARPLIINGWVRSGHPDEETGQLVREVAAAATQVTGIPAERVLVVIGNSPARFAIEGGRVLPEPGQELAWLQEGV